jgi:hypothetical protein
MFLSRPSFRLIPSPNELPRTSPKRRSRKLGASLVFLRDLCHGAYTFAYDGCMLPSLRGQLSDAAS